MALLLALSSAPALHAQSPRPAAPQPLEHLPQTTTPQEGSENETRRKFERDQQKKANEERFQKVKDDTEKLVQLSNELKDYVGKANEHTLSLDVIKKAEEIEKLAKSVKDRMKG
jgi:5'-deoxynucleotidase YfbR-like HD superfamily hydrolase